MSKDGKLMDMLTGYAASHQRPFNIFVHMVGFFLFYLTFDVLWAEMRFE